MNLEKLYKLQAELDNHILENEKKRTGKEIDKDLLLDETILALLVEVGELANATRCFKHWSVKGPESKERILDELADVWHFYLSIGNQLELEKLQALLGFNSTISKKVQNTFLNIYLHASQIVQVSFKSEFTEDAYKNLGYQLLTLGYKLGFTDEEVEQAYMSIKKIA